MGRLSGSEAISRTGGAPVRELFGTDGVRGRAGDFLTPELAVALGRAAVAHSDAERAQVLIVRDTRESGEMLEAALAAGVSAGGGDALLAGVLPTPAAPLLLRRHGLDLAAVISASHNPYEDNGIKLFGPDGLSSTTRPSMRSRPSFTGRRRPRGASAACGASMARSRTTYASCTCASPCSI